MADPAMNPAAGKPRRLWKIVLVASLALNLAVAGLVVGTVLSGRLGDGPPRNFDLGLGPVARALEPQERRSMGRDMRQSRVLRDVDLRGRSEALIAALKADPFDPAQVSALLDAQAAQLARVQQTAQAALLRAIINMTPERRAAFAASLQAEMEYRPQRRASPPSDR